MAAFDPGTRATPSSWGRARSSAARPLGPTVRTESSSRSFVRDRRRLVRDTVRRDVRSGDECICHRQRAGTPDATAESSSRDDAPPPRWRADSLPSSRRQGDCAVSDARPAPGEATREVCVEVEGAPGRHEGQRHRARARTGPADGTPRRVLIILRYLAGRRPASTSAIVRDCHIPRSSAYRLLHILQEEGFILFDPDAQRWGLGPVVVRAGVELRAARLARPAEPGRGGQADGRDRRAHGRGGRARWHRRDDAVGVAADR